MADSSFIDEIRQTEHKSAQIIDDAHRQAKTSQKQAQEEAKAIVDEARHKAGTLLAHAHAKAEQEAEKIASDTEKETAGLEQKQRDEVSSRFKEAVQAVSERIVSLSVDH